MQNLMPGGISDRSEDGSSLKFSSKRSPKLERAMEAAFADPQFWRDYHAILKDFVGRPSPIYVAERLVDDPNAATVVFKREDLNHTGAHKINNTVGQALLARRMGKKRLIAETGAGQHGVATATVGAKLGFPVDVYMGANDVERQSLNVYVMKLLGAQVHPVTSGTQTLKDATNEAFREWAGRVEDTFYVIGSVVGAHPYPYMVREFQKVIGIEARAQTLKRFDGCRPTSSRASAAAAMRWASSPASSTIPASSCGASKRPDTGSIHR